MRAQVDFFLRLCLATALGLRIKETKEVYEGEVTEMTPEETENPHGGFSKTISHVVVTLKTAKGTKQLRLDASIYESLQKERVQLGDVIYIEANSGSVKVRVRLFEQCDDSPKLFTPIARWSM